MKYREMALSDYNDILFLWQESQGIKLRDADTRESIEKYLIRNPGLSFVAEHSSNIVGTIMSGHDGKRGYIQHLVVRGDMRQAGIATTLLAKCIDALKIEGILKSHIHVLSDNDLAKKYWLNRGWKERNDIDVYSYINGGNENT